MPEPNPNATCTTCNKVFNTNLKSHSVKLVTYSALEILLMRYINLRLLTYLPDT